MSSRSRATKAKPRKKGLSLIEKTIAVIIIITIVWAAYSFSQPPPATTNTSGLAPDFTLPVVNQNGLTGQKVSLASFRGKVVFLEFMVPWCVHCQNMAPILEKLYQQYGRENVVFLSVSGAWRQSPGGAPASASDAATFIRTYQSSWTYVYDSSNSIFNAYGVNQTPIFFIIAKDGKIAATFSGEVAAETLAAAITRLNV